MSASRIANPNRAQEFRFRPLDGASPADKSPPYAVVKPMGKSGASPGKTPQDPHEVEREAFEKGYAAGDRAGMQMAEKKVDAVLRRFGRSMEKLARLREEIIDRSERDLVALAVEIARKLVHREINLDKKIINTFVRIGLEKLNVDSKVTIHLNPSDFKQMEGNLPEGFSEKQDIEIVLKPRQGLQRGDCLMETENGTLDGRIDEQFKEIEKGLLGEF